MPSRPTHHQATVDDFGREWRAFDQSGVSDAEVGRIFDAYFRVFPWDSLPENAIGIDVGCGSGRWADQLLPRVGGLIFLDASHEALTVAGRRLGRHAEGQPVLGAAGALPIRAGSLDFGYSLGVLHHTPDPAGALADCVATLRPGAPFLVYLYYALDNRPRWFRLIWLTSDLARRRISTAPFQVKLILTTALATLAYWPLARIAAVAEKRGFDVGSWPLSFYRDKSFYVMRNDALDRFGTRLEHRFKAEEVRELMTSAGLEHIVMSNEEPYWCAVGRRTG